MVSMHFCRSLFLDYDFKSEEGEVLMLAWHLLAWVRERPNFPKPPFPPIENEKKTKTETKTPGVALWTKGGSSDEEHPVLWAPRSYQCLQLFTSISCYLKCWSVSFHHHRAPGVQPGPHKEAGQQKALNAFYGLVVYSKAHLLIMRCCLVTVSIDTFG